MMQPTFWRSHPPDYPKHLSREDEACASWRLYGRHEWRYHDPKDGVEFTGYLERCEECGVIQQVPQ